MKLLIDSRIDSGVTVEQHQFNFELFIFSLGRRDSISTMVRQRSDSGATAQQQQERLFSANSKHPSEEEDTRA